MKLRKMLAGVLAVVSLFCMSTTAMAAPPVQDNHSIESAKIAAAKEIAYMDVETASAEMQERILAARETIIDSKSWVADGFEVTVTRADGPVTKIPQFSKLFPGWDIPAGESTATARSRTADEYFAPYRGDVYATLYSASSSVNADPTAIFYDVAEELDVWVSELYVSTSCNLGFTNMITHQSVAHLVDMRQHDKLGVLAVSGNIVPLGMRASTYSTPGAAKLDCHAW